MEIAIAIEPKRVIAMQRRVASSLVSEWHPILANVEWQRARSALDLEPHFQCERARQMQYRVGGNFDAIADAVELKRAVRRENRRGEIFCDVQQVGVRHARETFARHIS